MAKKVKEKIIAVLGYGSQGRAMSQNLRDSGWQVVVGLNSRSKSRQIARRDGIKKITTVRKAVAEADVVCMALPDHLHGRIFKAEIADNLRPGTTLWFLHGLSVNFGLVEIPKNNDVILIAPHGPGLAVRAQYLGEKRLSGFYAIAQNKSGKALQTVFRLTRAVGIQKKRLVKTTFRDEAVGDIFGEQAVLCGGLAMLIRNGFDTLVENGLKPEAAYLEVAYQLDLIVGLVKQYGIQGMLERISKTAALGAVVNGPKIIDKTVRKNMGKVYREIESGKFVRDMLKLDNARLERLIKKQKNLTNPSLEKAARQYSKK